MILGKISLNKRLIFIKISESNQGEIRGRRMTKVERAVQVAAAVAHKKKKNVEKRKKISLLQRLLKGFNVIIRLN